ncbi:MAG: RNA pseudouridine synthase [Bacteroides sp.]|nr:RNA pseudouridine synthase [Bacteroides sp.]
MNNPFDYTPDAACEDAFGQLLALLDSFKESESPADVNFCREIEAGKMLGVLIAEDDDGARHSLYAFSGQLGDGGFYHYGFVEAVFDYLQPDGYFKTREADISRQNAEIAQFEESILAEARTAYERSAARMEAEIADCKEHCRRAKLNRKARRESGLADETELTEMLRQSQFEKAELHRLKKRLAAELQPLAGRLNEAQCTLDAMKEKRRADSEALQQWLFTNFRVLNARGESKSLNEIFADTPMKIPPSGAGECCGPKLLQAAYKRGLRPVAMAEYWYGKPKGGEVRRHGDHYPACRGKCLPVLGWMLRGLTVEPPLESDGNACETPEPEIVHENQWFCVVNKPSGMLSVPGKGSAVSVEQWLSNRYGQQREVKVAHRLDQDTSGLLIAAFGQQSFKLMQSLFATRKVKKTYEAVLEGNYLERGLERCGRISLPLSPDWLDRPRQRVDLDDGKEAVTDYVFTAATHRRSYVTFHPLTGRTHQLRIHAASTLGLGMPIAGDRLYGTRSSTSATKERLHLHAKKIEFTFPLDNHNYIFEVPTPFGLYVEHLNDETKRSNAFIAERPNKTTLAAMKEAESSNNLETLDLSNFRNFVDSQE